jgi:hypothetical protein
MASVNRLTCLNDRSVSDIELGCRLVFGQQSLDYDPAPIPYRGVTLPTKLKFGYYLNGVF